MARTIKCPRYGGSHWPDGVVTIEKLPEERLFDLYDVMVDGEKVGQIEKGMNTHSIPLKGTRLSRGQTRPRSEWRPAGQYNHGLWWDTAGEAINRLIRDGAQQR